MRIKYRDHIVLILLLAAAAAIRLWSIGSMSLANDELSSLASSTTANTWTGMIETAVMKDGHPPFTYSFLRFWICLFGDSAFSLRLPFVLAGLLGLYFTWLTGRLWFSGTTALLAVAFLSVTSYMVYYHQMARPYALGFLWVQAAAYYWSLFLFGNAGRRVRYAVLWTLTAVLSCYTHYFSMMAVGLMGLTGLFFINKACFRLYFLSGFVVLLCLLPGFAIFRQQLSYGGLTWVGPPENDWLLRYLCQTMNGSVVIYVVMALLFLVSLLNLLQYRKALLNKFQWIGMAWFGVSFLIGFFKSRWSAPVLQPSCLVFTFPFLALVFFSLWRDILHLRGLQFNTGPLAVAVLLVCAYDTVCTGKYYETEHHGEFKGLAQEMAVWDSKYGSNNILRVVNVNNPMYWDYYWVKDMHQTAPVAMYALEESGETAQLNSLLARAPQTKLIMAWSNRTTPDTVYRIISKYYPHTLKDEKHFNSGILMYER